MIKWIIISFRADNKAIIILFFDLKCKFVLFLNQIIFACNSIKNIIVQ